MPYLMIEPNGSVKSWLAVDPPQPRRPTRPIRQDPFRCPDPNA
jgi:hypothetical protein